MASMQKKQQELLEKKLIEQLLLSVIRIQICTNRIDNEINK